MITATLYVSEGPVNRTVRVRATTFIRALEIVGANRPGVSVQMNRPAAPVTIADANTTLATALTPGAFMARAA